MYAKAGRVEKAMEMFSDLRQFDEAKARRSPNLQNIFPRPQIGIRRSPTNGLNEG